LGEALYEVTMSILDIHNAILCYGDGEVATTNPQRRFVDWQRHVTSVAVNQPSVREYVAQPGELLTIFSGTRTTTVDGTTAMSTTLNAVKDGTYRLAATGGTAPGFRTDRGLTLNTQAVQVTINNNATADFTLTGTGTFTGVQAGDVVFIPSAATGDSALNSPFNPNNGGFWTVLGVAAKKLTMKRRVGESFVGAAETVTLTSSAQFVAFSSTGVQVDDNLEISAGFSTVTQKSFVVSEVTPSWVEFVSTEPLPLETGILPTASGLTFYSDSKRFIRIEVDQEAVVRLNGDSGSTNRLSPRVAGDPEQVAHFEKWGPAWDVRVLNRSTTSQMRVTVISAE
jgi:hypothetical protein